jgi:pyruvate dehydrogenase E2 component (dihydrolipoamide acetyltransferase)
MSATGSLVNVAVPDIGDFGEVPVIEILVSIGDTVVAEDPLVTLESDKATMDVPSPSAGVVKAIHVKLGDKVGEGSALVDLEAEAGGDAKPSGDAADAVAEDAASSGAASSASPPGAVSALQAAADDQAEAGAPNATEPSSGASGEATATQAAPAPSATPPAKATNGTADGAGVYASPSVRRLARELSVDLHGVSGSGRKGRVVAEDVRGAGSGSSSAAVPTNGSAAGLKLAPWPTVDFEKFGEVERVERSRIQRISAPNLARNWVMIPHVTHNDEADITELEAWRKQLNAENAKSGAKFTMVSFLIAACVATLKEFPTFNSSLDGDELVLRKYFNIGFAADTPGGLVVPVIKNADTKGLVEIAQELTALSGKAREGKIGPGDMSGGTFTISSLGGIGGTSFTPIINAPEVAILGVTRAAIKPIWDEQRGEFTPRLMVPLSLSYDHRVIDGASAARFVAHLVTVLSDLRRALL